jgi:hypothetical protein
MSVSGHAAAVDSIFCAASRIPSTTVCANGMGSKKFPLAR